MATLAEIREKLKNIEDKKNNRLSGSGDKVSYPFWNIKDNEQAVLRFLPDANKDNTFFWVEKQMIKLEFPGVEGGDRTKPVMVQVPCVDMWGEKCPVMREISPWFNDESLKPLASKYWKKRTYLFQGFVRENPIDEKDMPENTIRRFTVMPQVFEVIKSALLDPDMDNIPTDYLNGTDFRLTKTQKGGFANYSTSSWARKESSLTQAELEVIEKYGTSDLTSLLPKRPNAEELAIIYDMFQASVEGELYDADKWGRYFKPFGLEYSKSNTESKSSFTPPTATAAIVVEPMVTRITEISEPTVAEAAPVETSKSVNDILEMIKNRELKA